MLALAQYEAPAKDQQPMQKVKVRLVKRAPKEIEKPKKAPDPPKKEVAPEPPKKAPEPPKKVQPKPKKKKRVIRKPRKVKKLPPKPKKPAPVDPPKMPPKKKRSFSVNVNAVASGGGIAVPTVEGEGNVTADASDPTLKPGTKKDGRGGTKTGTGTSNATQEPEDLDVVTRLPKLVRRPSAKTMRELYPKAAREEGREADVLLRLVISEKGRVVRVKVVRSGGKDFDKVAKKLARKYRYRPAMRGTEPVAVEIDELFKFRLD